MSERDYLTADELAEQLRLQPSTIRQWSRRGLIPAVRLSPKVVRFQLEAVVEALAARQRGGEGGHE